MDPDSELDGGRDPVEDRPAGEAVPAAGGDLVLDRGDLDRVIRRAVELQFDEGEAEDGRSLTSEEVLRIGREVGVEERHLRRALGELRAEALVPAPAGEEGPLARYAGPASATASRVVPGSVSEVERALSEHFRAAESLTRIRSRGGRSRWEPAEGVLAELHRGLFRWRGYRYDLARASAIELVVTPLEDGFSLVTMTADLRSSRAGNFFGYAGGFAAAGGGIGATLGVALAGGWPVIVPGVIAGAAIGALTGRSAHARELERVRLGMEGILDRLETGEPLARKARGLLEAMSFGTLEGGEDARGR